MTCWLACQSCCASLFARRQLRAESNVDVVLARTAILMEAFSKDKVTLCILLLSSRHIRCFFLSTFRFPSGMTLRRAVARWPFWESWPKLERRTGTKATPRMDATLVTGDSYPTCGFVVVADRTSSLQGFFVPLTSFSLTPSCSLDTTLARD